MKDLLPLSFAGENRWLWLTGVQLQMAALYGPMRTMSKNQCATQTLLRHNWKSNKKSVFNACPDQYSDLVNGRPLFPWWNRLSVVTKTVCPYVWLSNALSEAACKVCTLVKWTGKKREQRRNAHCLINNQPLGHLHFWANMYCLHFFFFFFPNTGRKCTGGHKHLKHIQRAEREKDETPSARPSLSLFDVLMKWSLNVRQVSHLHARPFLHPCTHYSAN